jgi:MarR family transcriptional regulator, organic hydroperoxide resistance regulator
MSASKLRIYHRLQLAAHRIQKAADRAVLQASGVTTAQAAVLAVVAANREATQRSVARQLGINESAVTAMVARLMDMRLIERVRDDEDARTWRLHLTAEGRAGLKKIEGPFRTINARLEAALDASELEHLSDYLGRIGEAFAGD